MGFEIDFLPVGGGGKSGDAIALRFGNLLPDSPYPGLYPSPTDQTVVVVDGGYLEVGPELVKHIKTYYGTDVIDLVVSTHPDGDHVNGLRTVLEEMVVRELFLHRPWLHMPEPSQRGTLRGCLNGAWLLEELATNKGIRVTEPFTGVSRFNGALTVVGPTRSYYESLIPEFRCFAPPQPAESALQEALRRVAELARRMAETFDVETLDDSGTTSAENLSGVILYLALDGQQLLLTADTGMPSLTLAADYMEGLSLTGRPLNFMQVPHHGSKRNVGPMILDRLPGAKNTQPPGSSAAVVSAAPDGAPKHPAKKVTNAFMRRGASVVVTRGNPVRYSEHAPDRLNWGPVAPEPFHQQVEE
jgi:beta-lactamase superfamily II metal-dependent hydrolase